MKRIIRDMLHAAVDAYFGKDPVKPPRVQEKTFEEKMIDFAEEVEREHVKSERVEKARKKIVELLREPPATGT